MVDNRVGWNESKRASMCRFQFVSFGGAMRELHGAMHAVRGRQKIPKGQICAAAINGKKNMITKLQQTCLHLNSRLSTGLDAASCSVSLPPALLLLAMLTSTPTADAAPGASIVADDMALWSLLSFLGEDDEEEGPSQFAALALGKENNVITTRCSSGWQEPDPAVDGRVM